MSDLGATPFSTAIRHHLCDLNSSHFDWELFSRIARARAKSAVAAASAERLKKCVHLLFQMVFACFCCRKGQWIPPVFLIGKNITPKRFEPGNLSLGYPL